MDLGEGEGVFSWLFSRGERATQDIRNLKKAWVEVHLGNEEPNQGFPCEKKSSRCAFGSWYGTVVKSFPRTKTKTHQTGAYV